MSLKNRILRAGRAFFAEHDGDTVKNEDLIFISVIKRDGSGTVPLTTPPSTWYTPEFKIRCLSVTAGTYIASDGASTYVVKLKQ
jgi:hypothetical protein